MLWSCEGSRVCRPEPWVKRSAKEMRFSGRAFRNSLLEKGSGGAKEMWREGCWAPHAGSKVGVRNFRFQIFKFQNVPRNKTVSVPEWPRTAVSNAFHNWIATAYFLLLLMIVVLICHFSTSHLYLSSP